GLLILARSLADDGGVTLGVEQVVRELESRSKRVAEAAQCRDILLRGLAKNAARNTAEGNECARLHGLQVADVGLGQRLSRRFEVQHLSAGHARAATGARKLKAKLGSYSGAGMRARIGKHLESKRQQCIACEDGGRFIECLVHRRAAAPQI